MCWYWNYIIIEEEIEWCIKLKNEIEKVSKIGAINDGVLF
jgi:hypothetical protein